MVVEGNTAWEACRGWEEMRDKDWILETWELKRRAGEDEVKRMLEGIGITRGRKWEFRGVEIIRGRCFKEQLAWDTLESAGMVKAEKDPSGLLSRSSIGFVVEAPFCGGKGAFYAGVKNKQEVLRFWKWIPFCGSLCVTRRAYSGSCLCGGRTIKKDFLKIRWWCSTFRFPGRREAAGWKEEWGWRANSISEEAEGSEMKLQFLFCLSHAVLVP